MVAYPQGYAQADAGADAHPDLVPENVLGGGAEWAVDRHLGQLGQRELAVFLVVPAPLGKGAQDAAYRSDMACAELPFVLSGEILLPCF